MGAPRWTGSLRTKLLLAFLLAALAPLAIVVRADLRALQEAVTVSAQRALYASATQTAQGVEGFLGANLASVSALARLPALVDFAAADPARQAQERARVVRVLDSLVLRDRIYLRGYALLDPGGRVLAWAGDHPPEVDVADRDWFTVPLQSGLPFVSPVELDAAAEAHLVFSAPVLGPRREPMGVLCADFGAAVLQSLVARSGGALGPGSFAVLVDENGLALAQGDAPTPAPRLAVPLAPERAAALVAASRLPRALAERPDDALLGAADLAAASGQDPFFRARLQPGGHDAAGALVALGAMPWRVVALQPAETFLAPVRAQTRRALAVAAPLAVLAALLAVALSERLSRRLARLTLAARRVAAGDLEARAGLRSGDEIGRLAATFDDMAARIRAREEALAAETERLAVTLRSIADGVITTDLQGRVVLLNAAAEQLTGWPQPEAAGRPVREVLALAPGPDGAVPDAAGEALRTGRVVASGRDARLVARGGRARAVADSAAPIRDREGAVVGAVLVFRDVTEQRQAEAELARMEKLESLGVLAGGIAHDLNNILAVVAGNLSALKQCAGDEGAAELADARDAALRAAALARQLLTFARGGAPIKQTASIGEIIETSVRFVLHGSKVRCELALPPDLPPVEVDPVQMEQVIQNLALNALQAMPTGGALAVAGRAVERPAAPGRPGGALVEVTLRDTGTGIPPEHLDRIFDPYFTTKANGSGLGLATAYSIVKRHEGRLSVESRVGVGTTFRIELPASTRRPPPPRARPAPDAGKPRRGRVLVVDDDDAVRRSALRLLRALGYESEGARGAAEALDKYGGALRDGARFDLVLMDLTIPGDLGGQDILAELRRLDPGVAAVVSSGYSSDPVMSRFREHGFRAVLEKPYTLEQLEVALGDALAAGPAQA